MREKYRIICRILVAEARKRGHSAHINDIEGFVHEAFIMLYSKWNDLPNKDNLTGWVYSTARGLMLNYYCSMSVRSTVSSDSLNSPGGTVDGASMQLDDSMQKLDDMETTEEMLDIIKSHLEPDSYQFLLECFNSDISADQLAKKYNVSRQSIYMRKKRLLEKLKSLIFNIIITQILLVLGVPNTLLSRGGENDGDEHKENEKTQTVGKKSDREKPMLSEKDLETILMYVGSLPPTDKTMDIAQFCLDALAESSAESAPGESPNVNAAIRKFHRAVKKIEAQKRAEKGARRRLSKHAIAVIIVVGLLAVGAVCSAMGWLPWRSTLVEEEERYLIYTQVGDEGVSNRKDASEEVFLPTGLNEEFDATLKEYEIFVALPTWIPEGLELEHLEAETDVDETESSVLVHFSKGRSKVIISVTKYLYAGAQVTLGLEKDDRVYEEIIIEGQKYILYSNRDRINVVWYTPPYECAIHGRISDEEMIRVINSIYER